MIRFSLPAMRLALAVPVIALLASCGQVNLSRDPNLVSQAVTEGKALPEYPDDSPSSTDGKAVWNAGWKEGEKQMSCAQCHGDGTGGSAGVNFADHAYGDKQKPVDQYMFVTYGMKTGEDGKTTEVPNHPKTFNQLTKRQRWDLVFYCRSLSRPVINSDTPPLPEFLALDATFGSNCAVCHGKKGNGDGPLAHNLEPVPANFENRKRFFDRTDAVLWDHIANGIPWEGMPNFQTHGVPKHDKAKNVTFDDAYIWKLVQYVRHFQSTDKSTQPIASNTLQPSGAPSSTTAAPDQKSGHNQN